MITEQYVSFDTAKMLKDAGFDGMAHKYYYRPRLSGKMEERFAMSPRNLNKEPRCISLPTQALAARWLREVHGIIVDVTFCPPKQDKNWKFFIGEIEDMIWEGDYDSSNERYTTYEEAMEDALRQALRRIIKNEEQ